MSKPIIELNNVWKRYGLPFVPAIKQQFAKMNGRETHLKDYGPWALQDINLTIQKGESVGMIGRNGAGKSTLLKLLAGVSPPTHGTTVVSGSVFPMIELSAGINADLTGYENIQILAAVMRILPERLEDVMPKIVEFSELGDWLERPARKYSSGMMARLGFSVAVHADADILLIDEVLSVGDVAFQKKCLARVDQLLSEDKTILFVSHSPYAIQRICDRAIYLENGKIVADDDVTEIMTHYFADISEATHKSIKSIDIDKKDTVRRAGSGDFRVDEITLLDSNNDPVEKIKTNDPTTIRLKIKSYEPVMEVTSLAVRVHDFAGTIVCNFRTSTEMNPSLKIDRDMIIDIHIPALNLMAGIYWLEFITKTGPVMVDHYNYALQFEIVPSSQVILNTGNLGLVYQEGEWDIRAVVKQDNGEQQ